MKKVSLIPIFSVPFAAAVPAMAAADTFTDPQTESRKALILLVIISAAMIAFAVFFSIATYRNMKNKSERAGTSAQKIILTAQYLATAIVLVFTIISFVRYRSYQTPSAEIPSTSSTAGSAETQPSGTYPEETEAAVTTAPAPTDPTLPTMEPIRLQDTNPDNWGITWDIIEHGSIVESYERAEPIHFGAPEEYFPFPGISTFRGNNYRNNPVYGSVNITEGALETKWTQTIGSLNGWPGSGWTGQPLIVQWDQDTKNIMNLYDSKKQKADLVEVIYATLDGYVYFYDLEDGSYSRDPLYLGMNFKGAGSLDPRGYPIMYVGSGDFIKTESGQIPPRMYVVSLIDGSILYKKSGADAFAQRDWCGFDSSPLVHAETDTLIWPGENGILYTIKLNTNYDKAAGTLSINPEETVKTRYTTKRSLSGNYWIGYEPSAVVVDQYLYISENGGMFYCIDLNKMEIVWAQDTKDDSNSTPVFEWDLDGNGYLYTAPSLHWTASQTDGSNIGTGTISIYKLNAKTGEIVWEVPFDCYTVKNVSGGIQSSPLLGKPGTELDGLIIYTIARLPSVDEGKLVALDTDTGDIVWEKPMSHYAWSSPIALYNDDGTAHIIVCDSIGNMSLLNSSGDLVEQINLGSNIEATPTAFNDTVIVGTRGQKICGIKVK